MTFNPRNPRDVIARPIFGDGKVGLPGVPPGTQGLPCPHCGRMIPLQIKVNHVNLEIVIPSGMVARVKDVKSALEGP